MFSPDIVESDAFLEMPQSSQNLYFHLGMYADDDGFVNPRKIMRLIGASEDDLKVLAAKRFVLPFENGVIVIKHWRINNFIRRDRYRETLYLKEKSQLLVRGNQGYTLNADGDAKPVALVPWKADGDSGQPVVDQRSTQDRLGKVRIGKDTNTLRASFDAFYAAYPNKKGKVKAQQKWLTLKPDADLVVAIMAGLERDKASVQWQKDGGQFIPHPTTWLNQRRWEDEGVAPLPNSKTDRF